MRAQHLLWTAIPNGRMANGDLRVSVLCTPRLLTDQGGDAPSLSLFPDFLDWPALMDGASFSVVFGTAPNPATRATAPSATGSSRWRAVFRVTGQPPTADATKLTPWVFADRSGQAIRTFPAASITSSVGALWGDVGRSSPTSPPEAAVIDGKLGTTPSTAAGRLKALADSAPLAALAAYFDRGDLDPGFQLPEPTLDFHQTIAGLGTFPIVLRDLSLLIDLVVPVPAGITGQTTIRVQPTFTSSFAQSTTIPSADTTVNLCPLTAVTLSASDCVATAQGASHTHGMLDLSPGPTFSVIALDVEGAGRRVGSGASVVRSLDAFQDRVGTASEGGTVSLPLPALSTSGPQILWTQRADAITARIARQAALEAQLSSHVSDPRQPVPTLYAEDLVRGHRIDVKAIGPVATPWRSLHQRDGVYAFDGDVTGTIADEGMVTTTAAGVVGTMGQASTDLYVSEALARWTGWSLSAPRPGGHVGLDSRPAPAAGNPMSARTDGHGHRTPAFSARFSVTPGTLPKLRFGTSYRYRARAVDLAGNGLGPATTDESAATAASPFLRYEPVARPVVVETAELGPGASSLVLVLRNDQVNPPATVARWLFPPKVAELTAEQHGMLDGFVAGKPPDPAKPPSGGLATFAMVVGTNGTVGRADATVADLPGVITPASHPNGAILAAGPTSESVTVRPSTPWFADPLSVGPSLLGLPGDAPGTSTVRPWPGGPWPALDPILMRVTAAKAAGHAYAAPTGSKPGIETVSLPPAAVYNVRLSSGLADVAPLGVWRWITDAMTTAGQANQIPALKVQARAGRLWQLTPAVTLRLVHAVRLPLVEPTFQALAPSAKRKPGSTSVALSDPMFKLDAASTASVEVLATWVDRVDDAQPESDPTVATATSTGRAFRYEVPDPAPSSAKDNPLQMVPKAPGLPLVAGTHDLGDTRHHHVTYRATASSRFAEHFAVTATIESASNAPFTFSSLGLPAGLPVEPSSVVVRDDKGRQIPRDFYAVDAVAGTFTLDVGPKTGLLGSTLEITFTPKVTVKGPTTQLHVLSTARPAAPAVDRVTPAWSIAGPSSVGAGMTAYARRGNVLRVWMDRPWFSSGDGELLGVVTLPGADVSTSPPDAEIPGVPDPHRLTTVMGLDPITEAWSGLYEPTTPATFGGTATLPSVPGRAQGWASPPLLPLTEDPSGKKYQITPYDVSYDKASGQWYADIRLVFAKGQAPPPGYFVRLALVRFQPYAIEATAKAQGAELSNVVVATFAQPVVDRSVSVVARSVSSFAVSVSGPSYLGFRAYTETPGDPSPQTIRDQDNLGARHAYSPGSGGPMKPVTSMMVAEVQVQDTSGGLIGDLAWMSLKGTTPIRLVPAVSGSVASWSGDVVIPANVDAKAKLRIRLSELDYVSGDTAPSRIDNRYRRPFVAHIPIR